ncbi:MAG: alpha-2-macroglobulin, partial [Deltaproteobacteria bacterium]|nr:alpha-2-macroglobulin [Deltaproteobacteria bacterium]
MKTLSKIITVLFFYFGLAAAAEAARVERFSPQGTVKEIRQVTARFSEAMVPFGDPRLEDPFSLQCPEKGKGRWVDGRTWAYDFERDLPAGVICTFQLKPDLKTLDGRPVSGTGIFSFNTGGPSVRGSKPEEGHNRIDENQIFIFSLEAEADEASVEKGVYCSVEGIEERVGIRLLKGEEKDQLFKDLKMKKEKFPVVVFQCRRTFPAAAEVRIVWGKGIKTLSNIPTVEDQTLVFKTRQPFYARFRGKKEKPTSGCIPLLPMKLVFSAPVPWETARQIQLVSQTGKIWKPQPGGEGHDPLVDWILFEGPFPENTSFTLHLPKKLKDDAGRPLSNQDQFPLKVKTDRYPSLAKFSARFGIIEWNEGGILPLTVRNLEAEIKAWITASEDKPGGPVEKMAEKTPDPGLPERASIRPLNPETGKGIPDQWTGSLNGKHHHLGIDKQEKIIEWLKILKSARREESILKGREGLEKISIPKKGGPKELEVIGIPLKEPGFHVLELESTILGSRLLNKPQPIYVPAAALVTNLAAHFKWGRASSLVWVTTLDQGETVRGATVTVRDCSGRKHWQGKTDESGVARISAALPSGRNLPRCRDKREEEEYWPPLSGIQSGLFVFAETQKDLTFTHTSWDEGIESWRFNVPSGNFSEPEKLLAHTVFDRTLFRAGEEVQMKHFLRKPAMKGLFLHSQMEEINEIIIEHARSNQQYVFPLKWRPNGSAETVFKIPDHAKLGTYEVSLASKSKQPKIRFDQKLGSGSFRVEEFRVPLMKAFIQGPKDPVIKAREVELDLSVRYLSGGGAARLPVKVRTEIQPRFTTFPDYEDFVFSNGKIKPGMIRPREYDPEDDQGFNEAEGRTGSKKENLHSLDLTLDPQGVLRTRLPGIPEIDSPRDFFTELEFRDPNGEIQTVSSRTPLFPARGLIGIQAGTNEQTKDSLKYTLVVLDLKGKPIPRVEVGVNLLERKTYSYRRRLTGGFYAYENTTEIKEGGRHCQGKTDQNGLLFCQGKSPFSGPVILQAEALDDRNSPFFANQEIWVSGKGDPWDEARNDDRIDLIPEKRRLEPGDRARFQVRMPFRQARVLITVEREGVLDTYVKNISRERPMVEIPVKKNYAPNVFVSALVVRGRLPQTRPTALFDPGKPAYKLGLTEIKVGWKPHELKVEVQADPKIYTPRETVAARILVKTAYGTVPPKGSEVAVAVVDEGL